MKLSRLRNTEVTLKAEVRHLQKKVNKLEDILIEATIEIFKLKHPPFERGAKVDVAKSNVWDRYGIVHEEQGFSRIVSDSKVTGAPKNMSHSYTIVDDHFNVRYDIDAHRVSESKKK